jgi:hypothetical protein
MHNDHLLNDENLFGNLDRLIEEEFADKQFCSQVVNTFELSVNRKRSQPPQRRINDLGQKRKWTSNLQDVEDQEETDEMSTQSKIARYLQPPKVSASGESLPATLVMPLQQHRTSLPFVTIQRPLLAVQSPSWSRVSSYTSLVSSAPPKTPEDESQASGSSPESTDESTSSALTYISSKFNKGRYHKGMQIWLPEFFFNSIIIFSTNFHFGKGFSANEISATYFSADSVWAANCRQILFRQYLFLT